MDPITAAAAIGAAGGIAEAGISGAGQMAANRSNKKMAREEMAFQERMSSTALQRMRLDAEAAGINPIYWASKGSAASSPGGAMSTSQNIAEGVKGTTAKALEARVAAANIGNLEAMNDQIMSQAALNTANAGKVIADTAAVEAGLPEKILKGTLWQDVSSAVSLARDMLAGKELKEGSYAGGLFKVRKKK